MRDTDFERRKTGAPPTPAAVSGPTVQGYRMRVTRSCTAPTCEVFGRVLRDLARPHACVRPLLRETCGTGMTTATNNSNQPVPTPSCGQIDRYRKKQKKRAASAATTAASLNVPVLVAGRPPSHVKDTLWLILRFCDNRTRPSLSPLSWNLSICEPITPSKRRC